MWLKLRNKLWTFLKSNAIRIAFAITALVVVYLIGRNLWAAVGGGILGALLGGNGVPTDSPRRTGSGHISTPDPPRPPTSPSDPNGDTSPPPPKRTSPRRRRR